MSGGARSRGAGLLLEAFKFCVFITLPITAVVYFNTPEALVRVLEHRRYIVYPVRRPPFCVRLRLRLRACLRAVVHVCVRACMCVRSRACVCVTTIIVHTLAAC
jgi:hypothetical protein